jgi:hypothetical protein
MQCTLQISRKSAGCISMIIIGVALVVAFGFHEAYWDQVFPLFPPVVMRKTRGVILVLVGIFLFGMMYYPVAVLWPQQIQVLYTTDLTRVGCYASALGMTGIVLPFLVGAIFTKWGHARLIFAVIIAIGTVAAGCTAISKSYSTIFRLVRDFPTPRILTCDSSGPVSSCIYILGCPPTADGRWWHYYFHCNGPNGGLA